MPATNRFFASTRGRILARLLRGPMSIADLAGAFEISSNAARQHVTALERDGYVKRDRPKPTAGKPATTYRVTTAGRELFPKAYEAVLGEVVSELGQEWDGDDLEAFFHKIGRRLADRSPVSKEAPLEERIEAVVTLLTELGAVLEVSRFKTTGTVRIDGIGCPLSGVVRGHPELCQMLAAMIEDLTFQPTKVLCHNKEENPSCGFLVGVKDG